MCSSSLMILWELSSILKETNWLSDKAFDLSYGWITKVSLTSIIIFHFEKMSPTIIHDLWALIFSNTINPYHQSENSSGEMGWIFKKNTEDVKCYVFKPYYLIYSEWSKDVSLDGKDLQSWHQINGVMFLAYCYQIFTAEGFQVTECPRKREKKSIENWLHTKIFHIQNFSALISQRINTKWNIMKSRKHNFFFKKNVKIFGRKT